MYPKKVPPRTHQRVVYHKGQHRAGHGRGSARGGEEAEFQFASEALR